jgi:hypothetical protein
MTRTIAWKFFGVVMAVMMIVALGAVLVPVGRAEATGPTAYYVDAARPDDTGNGTSWATAKQKLQSAIALATTNGDTINVAAGTYTEHLVIANKANLTLKSKDGAATTIISARQTHGGTPDPGVAIRCSSGITIDGFSVNDVIFNVSGVVNPDADGEAHLMAAIFLDNVTNCVVKNNILRNFYYGIFLASDCYSAPCTCTTASCDNNTIQANEMHGENIGRIGVYLYSEEGGNQLQGNAVTGNTIEKTYYGIYLNPSVGAGSNTLSNNTITGSPDLVNWYPSGAYANPPSALDNGIGIVLGSYDDTGVFSGTISGNTISVCQTGIKVNAANFAATTVNDNNITGNLTYGVWNNAVAGTLNATNNWWGANDGPGTVGPGHGANVSGTVTYSPWLVLGVSASPTSIVANGTSTSTITADMTKNSAGAASGGFVPNGTSITIATTGGTVGSTSVIKTTINGLATATLTSSTTPGLVTVKATAPGTAPYSENSTTVSFVTDPALRITLTAVPSSIIADGTSPSALTATVKDQYGAPVADGVDVVFTTSKGTVGSSTVTKQTTGGTGTATATLTSAAGTQIVVADVSAVATGITKMIAVFFTPPSAPPITDNTTTTVPGSGTIPGTATGGSVSVDATGDHTVTTAKYGGDPGGTPSFNASGNYYDVHVDNTAGLNGITIQFSPATASTIIYYWTGTAWRAVSNQTYAGGIVTVTVTATTFPNLTDLSGLFFGSGTPIIPPAPPPVIPVSPLISTGPTTHGSSMPGVITPNAPPVALANIVVQSASLSAKSVTPGAPVTVTADIANKSTVNGSKKVTLYVNGQVETTQGLTVNSGSSSKLTFNVSRSEPGTYNVYVDGVPAGSFKVELFREADGILVLSATLVALAFLIGMVMLWRRQRTG